MGNQGEIGWIKLSRRITDHWIWSDAERLKWWLDLLLMAAWEEHQVMHDTHIITLQRGQMIASVGFLRDRWRKSHQTILRFLNLMEKEDMIRRSMMYRQTSIITICNYESYQVQPNCEVDTIQETMIDTKLETIVYTNKEIKNNNISPSLRSGDLSCCEQDAESAENEKPKNEGQKAHSCDEISVEGFVKFWNEELDKAGSIVPRIRSIEGTRRMQINARCREHGKAALAEVVRKVATSDFLNGKNNRGFVANFSWAIGPNNFQKILDGNYDNRSVEFSKTSENVSSQNQERRQDRRRGYDVATHAISDYEAGF